MNFAEFFMAAWLLMHRTTEVQGQTYEGTMSIFTDKLSSSNYHTEVRPVKDQSRPIIVDVSFEIVSIVKVDDVAQSFYCNGFVFFSWTDEMIAWTPSSYGGQLLIHPLPENIWRPRVILRNTLGDRDIFDDDKAPVFSYFTGDTSWVPGSLFPASCELNMEKYPFDEQTCKIQLLAMTLSSEELQFVSDPAEKVGTRFFTVNGEWDLRDSSIEIYNTSAGGVDMSSVDFKFTLRRRPYFLLLNIVLPVVFLSLLNILVFAIPVESGEKIAYGITVLLALTVFMSIVSAMLPRSSTMPRVTIYLFILLIISVLTVIDSIFIVFLYHMEEKEEQHQKVKQRFRNVLTKVTHVRRAISPIDTVTKIDSDRKRQESLASVESCESDLPPYSSDKGSNKVKAPTKEKTTVNKYKLIGKHIDLVSFVCFFLVWLGVTVGFMLNIAVF